MIVVLMGVSGAGKSTVGRALAARLGWTFLEGDAFHGAANREKMARGQALVDADRWPWLDAIGARLAQLHDDGVGAVLACSALRRAYRERLLAQCRDLWFVHLDCSRECLEQRVAGRAGHFMPASLLTSQLATLEPPAADECALIVAATGAPEALAARIEAGLAARGCPMERPRGGMR